MIKPSEAPAAWLHCIAVVRPAFLLAPSAYLQDVVDRLAADGVVAAVARHDTPVIYDWIVRLLARQGISNAAAEAFAERAGSPTWHDISTRMARSTRCPRLHGYWTYASCGYRRSTGTCSTLHHLVGCAVAKIPARKGALAEAAIALWLFVRDVCDGDLVGWIDGRLAAADPGNGVAGRAAAMRRSLIEPLTNIVGTGRKVWSMVLAELLLGADPHRERWTTTGASFVAVDSLVHAYLHRTGILRRLDSEHTYGLACHASGGCADVIAALAARIDAREFEPSGPACFPRWVQYALWSFCAADGWSICQGRNIDDRVGCQQRFCPSFAACDRLPFPPAAQAQSLNNKIDFKPIT